MTLAQFVALAEGAMPKKPQREQGDAASLVALSRMSLAG